MSTKFKMEKICKKCNTLLTLTQFHKASSHKDGHKNICKSCDNKRRALLDKKKQQLLKSKKKEEYLNMSYYNQLKQDFIKAQTVEEQYSLMTEMMSLLETLNIDKKRYFIVSKFDQKIEGLINTELSITYRMAMLPYQVETKKVKDKTIIIMPEDQIIPENIREEIIKKLHL